MLLDSNINTFNLKRQLKMKDDVLGGKYFFTLVETQNAMKMQGQEKSWLKISTEISVNLPEANPSKHEKRKLRAPF